MENGSRFTRAHSRSANQFALGIHPFSRPCSCFPLCAPISRRARWYLCNPALTTKRGTLKRGRARAGSVHTSNQGRLRIVRPLTESLHRRGFCRCQGRAWSTRSRFNRIRRGTWHTFDRSVLFNSQGGLELHACPPPAQAPGLDRDRATRFNCSVQAGRGYSTVRNPSAGGTGSARS